jgi:hypothetical protein
VCCLPNIILMCYLGVALSVSAIGVGDPDDVALPIGLAYGDSWSGVGLAEETQDRLLEGLMIEFLSAFTYDSNVSQGNDVTGPAQGDGLFILAPSVAWGSVNRALQVKVEASAAYKDYLSLSDFSGLDYRGGISGNYVGGPLVLNARIAGSSVQAIDIYNGGLRQTDQSLFDLDARYNLSPITALTAGFSCLDAQQSLLNGGNTASANDGLTTTAMAGIKWKASPLLTVGSTIQTKFINYDSGGDRSSVGPNLSAKYQLGGLIDLDASVGLDFVDFAGGESDQGWTGRLGALYRLDALWSFTLQLARGTEMNLGTGGGFRESNSVRIGLVHPVGVAKVQAGFRYETSDFLDPDGLRDRASVDLISIDSSVSLPLFENAATGSLFMRYQSSSSADIDRDWDGIQVGVSLQYKF